MKQILMPCGIAILIGLSTSTWAGKDDHVLVQEAAKNVVMVNQIAQLVYFTTFAIWPVPPLVAINGS